MNDRYDYNYEKERREAIEAGQRALNSLRAAQKELESARNWGAGGSVWRRFHIFYAETGKDEHCAESYGAGKV